MVRSLNDVYAVRAVEMISWLVFGLILPRTALIAYLLSTKPKIGGGWVKLASASERAREEQAISIPLISAVLFVP